MSGRGFARSGAPASQMASPEPCLLRGWQPLCQIDLRPTGLFTKEIALSKVGQERKHISLRTRQSNPSMSDAFREVEFRYKRRVYSQPLLDDKQFAKLHTKKCPAEKETLSLQREPEVPAALAPHLGHSWRQRGLGASALSGALSCPRLSVGFRSRPSRDSLLRAVSPLPSPECPLTMSAQLEFCAEIIKALKNGGAHLDFRTREGMTALHKAVRCRNHTALRTLLDLGASTDYKDSRGLTPLYHSVMVGGDPYCCELLLHDYAKVGCIDENGWQEIHQACRYGHVQHLEHLLFYGADMTAQNASGNTALHVCALYNQESCARVLLFRGASKEIRNYNSQTAFQGLRMPFATPSSSWGLILRQTNASELGHLDRARPFPASLSEVKGPTLQGCEEAEWHSKKSWSAAVLLTLASLLAGGHHSGQL
ncbi:SH3 and multiple ankyrin repeat domains protein 3, partial [Ophiophagus hannah]